MFANITPRFYFPVAAIFLLLSTASHAATDFPTEPELIAILTASDASENDRAQACQDLAAIGTEAAVPALAQLLDDPKFSHYARYGLQGIPSPAAGKALLAATERLQDDLLVGVINSLGARGEEAAVDRLVELLEGEPSQTQAAAAALVEIGTNEALLSLSNLPDDSASTLANVLLQRADMFTAHGRTEEAFLLYRQLLNRPVADHIAKAASLGLVQVSPEPQAVEEVERMLTSSKDWEFEAGLQAVVRSKVTAAAKLLAGAMGKASPPRQLALLAAIESRGEPAALPAVRLALQSGDKAVQSAAIAALGSLGQAADVAPLLKLASSEDRSLSRSALEALATIEADQVEQAILQLLDTNVQQQQAIAIQIVGRRRIAAAGPQLLKLAQSASGPKLRLAAIESLAQIAPPQLLPSLIDLAVSAQTEAEKAAARRAVRDASLRVADRRAAAELVAKRLEEIPSDQKGVLFDAMAAIGGEQALSFVTGAANSADRQLQDNATRVLGSWSTPDAAPALLQIARTEHPYRIRALRGYLRIARQLKMSDQQRIEMARAALDIAERPQERELAVEVLERAGVDPQSIVAETDPAPSSRNLFNGKDLAGWHMDVPALDKEPDSKKPFLVRDGRLVSLGEPRGHLISDEKYSNYRLEVEYRFAGKPGNCGVLVHASTPRELYDMFPKSLEVQMQHQHAGDFWCIAEDITVPDMVERRGPKRSWGTTKGKSRRILNLTDDSEKPLGQWNRMVIQCLADEVKVWVNEDLVNHGTNCTATSGQIAIQAEGSEVEFREVKLTPITELSD